MLLQQDTAFDSDFKVLSNINKKLGRLIYFTGEQRAVDGKAITEICRKNMLAYFIVS